MVLDAGQVLKNDLHPTEKLGTNACTPVLMLHVKLIIMNIF